MFSSLIDRGRRLVQAILLILESFKPTAVVIVMIRNAGAHGVGDMAAAVGYYGVLAIFPMILVTITLLSFFFDPETVVMEVHLIVAHYLPVDEALVGDNVDTILSSRGAIGIVSLLALVWSGSNVFGALTRFMDRAWGVADPHAFHLVRIKSLTMVVSVSGLLLLSLGSSWLVHAAEEITANGVLGSLAGVVHSEQKIFLGIASLFGAVLAALMLYRWLPSDRTPWKYAISAAVVAGISLEIIKNLFLFYLTNFGSFDAVYGSLASVVILLTWVYMTALVILVVAELGGALREVDARRQQGYQPL